MSCPDQLRQDVRRDELYNLHGGALELVGEVSRIGPGRFVAIVASASAISPSRNASVRIIPALWMTTLKAGWSLLIYSAKLRIVSPLSISSTADFIPGLAEVVWSSIA